MKRANLNRPRKGRLQRWVVPALVLLMAAAMLLIGSFVTRETQVTVGAPVYQYFMDQREDYGADTKIILTKHNVVLSENGEKKDGGSGPIYYRDTAALLLPERMGWSDPATGSEWQVPALSRLEADGTGAVWCDDGGRRFQMTGGFLSDAAGTFVFLDGASLSLDGQTVELAPLSFCTLRNREIYVYRYDSRELVHESGLADNVRVRGARYEADLTAGIYTAASGSKRLLAADPQALPELKK